MYTYVLLASLTGGLTCTMEEGGKYWLHVGYRRREEEEEEEGGGPGKWISIAMHCDAGMARCPHAFYCVQDEHMDTYKPVT